MKVAVLILSTCREPSTSNVQAMKASLIEYCEKNSSKFKHQYTFFEYYGVLDKDSDACNTMFSSDALIKETENLYKIELASEDGIYRTFEKTVKAFNIVNEHDTYDWFIRINISTYVNIPLLDKIFEMLDYSEIYCSAINTYISDESYLNDIYPRGDFYMFSKETYSKIQPHFSKYVLDFNNINNIFKNTVPHVDDCLLGLCIIDGLGPQYYLKLKTFTYSFLPNNTDIRGFNKFAISSRVKTMPPGVRYSGYSWEDNEYRRCDAEKIKKIHSVVTNIDYSNITPEIFKKHILLADDSPYSRPTLLVQMSNQKLNIIKANIKRKRG